MGILKDCIDNKKTDKVPIWLMRQAGRYLPEFKEIRSKNTNFIKLCLNPQLSKEITLQPIKRFSLDAAIIFSDILIIPFAMGQKVEFEKNFGPKLGELNIDEIFSVSDNEILNKLDPIYKLIKPSDSYDKDGNLLTEPDAVEKMEGDFRYVIPFKERNNEYKKYLAWKAEGNEPEAAD